MSMAETASVVYGVNKTPTYDYKGGITHLWPDHEAVYEMSLKFAVQAMGERGKDPSVVARIERAQRLARTGSHDANWYLHELQRIIDGKGL